MKDIAALHRAEYDVAPDIIAAAPGVVKFLGEHTEASDGLVLAAALSFEIQVAISLRRDSSLRFFAADLGERKRTSVGNLKFKREDRWANYPKGVLDLLVREGLPAKGVNFTITGDIPVGLGLASSAALGLASALAFKELFGLNKRGEELAELARRAEAEFLGHPVPSYDHLAGAAPAGGTVSIVDLRTDRRRAVPFLDGNYIVVLTDSKVPRMNVDAELKQRADGLPEVPGRPRARDQRRPCGTSGPRRWTSSWAACPKACGGAASMSSRRSRAWPRPKKPSSRATPPPSAARSTSRTPRLRNLYEVSCPEIDWLAKRAVEIEGVLCSRLTGKGFGGCTVTVMAESSLPEYRKRLEDYERIFGFRPAIHETRLAGGLRIVG